ncbi:MAG: pilus assembly protein [Planctomycetales bacterium]|nr:pilus assembly protein [Planctomycetales bacterium]
MRTQNITNCRKSRPKNGRIRHRKGVAVVEFAVCLPILVLITLGFIDLTNLIYFRQTIKIAAYDAARAAAEPASSSAEVQAAASRLMTMRGIDNWTLTIPDNFSSISRGGRVDLTLAVPFAEMTCFSGLDLWTAQLGKSVTVNISCVKE